LRRQTYRGQDYNYGFEYQTSGPLIRLRLTLVVMRVKYGSTEQFAVMKARLYNNYARFLVLRAVSCYKGPNVCDWPTKTFSNVTK